MCRMDIHAVTLLYRFIVLSMIIMISNHYGSPVLSVGLAGGSVHSHIVFSSLFMMRFENCSSVGTLEVSVVPPFLNVCAKLSLQTAGSGFTFTVQT